LKHYMFFHRSESRPVKKPALFEMSTASHRQLLIDLIQRLNFLSESGQSARMLEFDLLGQLVVKKNDNQQSFRFKFDDSESNQKLSSFLAVENGEGKMWNIIVEMSFMDENLPNLIGALQNREMRRLNIESLEVFNVFLKQRPVNALKGYLNEMYDLSFAENIEIRSFKWPKIRSQDNFGENSMKNLDKYGKWQELPSIKQPGEIWSHRFFRDDILGFVRRLKTLHDKNLKLLSTNDKISHDVFHRSALSTSFETFQPNPKDFSLIGLSQHRNVLSFLGQQDRPKPVFLFFHEIKCKTCTDYAMENMDKKSFMALGRYTDPTVTVVRVDFREPVEDRSALPFDRFCNF